MLLRLVQELCKSLNVHHVLQHSGTQPGCGVLEQSTAAIPGRSEHTNIDVTAALRVLPQFAPVGSLGRDPGMRHHTSTSVEWPGKVDSDRPRARRAGRVLGAHEQSSAPASSVGYRCAVERATRARWQRRVTDGSRPPGGPESAGCLATTGSTDTRGSPREQNPGSKTQGLDGCDVRTRASTLRRVIHHPLRRTHMAVTTERSTDATAIRPFTVEFPEAEA